MRALNLKTFAAFVLLLLGAISAYPQGKPPRIKSGLWRTVVRLENSRKGVGTGFLVFDEIERGGQKGRIRFLVTNKHMIGDYNLSDGNINNYYGTLKIWGYGKDSTPTDLTITNNDGSPIEHLVFLHPDPKIDVAMIALVGDVYQLDATALPLSNLSPFSDTDWVCFGDQVFALGYPRGITSLNKSVPIAKAGYISSLPGEMFRIMIPTLNRQNQRKDCDFEAKVFIVDGLLVPGNSGGPVIMPSENLFRHNPTTGQMEFTEHETPNSVIGIVSMGLGDSGLSIVYSSDYIVEMIKSYEDTIEGFQGIKLRFKEKQ